MCSPITAKFITIKNYAAISSLQMSRFVRPAIPKFSWSSSPATASRLSRNLSACSPSPCGIKKSANSLSPAIGLALSHWFMRHCRKTASLSLLRSQPYASTRGLTSLSIRKLFQNISPAYMSRHPARFIAAFASCRPVTSYAGKTERRPSKPIGSLSLMAQKRCPPMKPSRS